jgi:large subunit ribosomal protein L1
MAEAKKTTKKATKKEAELIVEAAPISEPEAEAPKEEKIAAKAGKRSSKALKETEAKQVKEERKAASKTDEEAAKPKTAAPARSRAERAGKKYQAAAKLVEADKLYALKDALELAVKTSPAKFDASVELHINLGVDPKQADQNVRDNVVMPAGTGKSVKIAVIAEPEDADKAKKAGADLTDADKIFADLDKETIEFDVLIAQPNMMAKLGKYARLLGPRGLMPNPKSGTVTKNVVDAVADAKAGKVEYRVDQAGIIHLAVGKVSFGGEKLLQNADAVMSSVRAAKPASLKGIYLKSLYVTTTMGPSIKVEIST